ncbi:cobalt ECF transporter T component CbiQ [Desulfonema ishimotonii]|uniref:Cobalt ECF transporter T component CbiQ n=1 Tax=Desulfonema ishimotonii TaxID=45657 RepID=A0A401FVT9_9BACT|nr:cobalt ECF transporter T component CbiQ [Desulfonema ishimotonii]GBC61054.1 cobalt ECF transporter T component CbiQ [Desulfonema ishimotonii]
MISEAFASGNSVMHRLDPRLKVIFATAFSFFVALSESFPVLMAGLTVGAGAVLLARLRLWEVARRLAVINFFNLILWMVLPITFEGEALYLLGPFTLTRPGVILSAQITIKSNAILLAFIGLIATSSLATVGHALNRLHVSGKIVHLLMMTYRYVFVIEQEYRRLVNAARMRSFQPGTNLHTYRTYAYLFGMLLVRASARAGRVYQAMLCRGFHGRFYCLHRFAFTRTDRIWAVLMSGIIVLMAVLQRMDSEIIRWAHTIRY